MALLHLRFFDGSESTRDLTAGVVVFGRAAECDLALVGEGISRRHGHFVFQNGVWWIEDLGSKNGIRVNGRPILRHRLSDGEAIEVGTCVLTYRSSDGSTSCLQPPVTLSDHPAASLSTVERQIVSLDKMDSRRLSILCGFSKQLLDLRSVDDLAASAAAALASELRAAVVVFGLTRDPQREPERLKVYPASSSPISLSISILRRAMETGRALLVTDARSDVALAGAQSIAEGGIRSAVCVPLMRNQDVTGFLYVDNRRGDVPYQEKDLDFVAALGGLVGTAIENARLHEAELAGQRMESELAAARRMQQVLLPSRWPVLPGWEIGGRHFTCREVGGDYYDALLGPDGRLWMVVADVCGKGAGAALLASAIHAGVHALARQANSPAALLAQLNQVLLRRDLGSSFVTCLAMVAVAETGEVTFCSAGHPGPFHIRKEGEVCEIELPAGFALGIYPDAALQEQSLGLGRGESLLLYTDGATEMLNAQSEAFGEQRLAHLLSEQHARPADDILAAVHAAISEFRGDCEPSDDLTLLFCRRA